MHVKTWRAGDHPAVLHHLRRTFVFSTSTHSHLRTDFLQPPSPTHTARMQPFRLMDLPAELRNEVYAHVLFEEAPIFIDVIRRFNGRKDLCRKGANREQKFRGKV